MASVRFCWSMALLSHSGLAVASEGGRLARFLAFHALQQAARRDHADDVSALLDRYHVLLAVEDDSDQLVDVGVRRRTGEARQVQIGARGSEAVDRIHHGMGL